MKASELHNIVDHFDSYYLWSDAHNSVKLGCDCGCGGDSYTVESWDEMVKESEEAFNDFKSLCEKLNVEWDY